METLIDFYKRVLEALGYTVTEDGYVMIVKNDINEIVSINKKTLVLPTKEHIESMSKVNENGEIEVTKVMFNPLNENVLKGFSPSFKIVKSASEIRAAGAIYTAGHLLLLLSEDKKAQENTPMYINKFLIKLTDAKNKNMTKIVDDKTVKLWEKLFSKGMEGAIDYVKIYVKKQGRINDTKYNRVATAKFPIYEEVLNFEKDVPVLDLNFRPKDAAVIKSLFEYLLPGLEEDNKIAVGSNDVEAPAFTALFSLYLKLMKLPNRVMKSLKQLDLNAYDMGHVEIAVTEDEVINSSVFKGSVVTIPDDVEVRKTISKQNTLMDKQNSMLTQQNVQTNSVIPVNALPEQQQTLNTQTQQLQQEVSTERSLVDKLLYGNGNMPPQVIIPNQQSNMVLPQNTLTPNIAPVPGGINTLANQQPNMVMPQQPMMQQPMMQQQPMSNVGYNQMQPMMQQQPMGNNSILGYPQQNVQTQVPGGINAGMYR